MFINVAYFVILNDLLSNLFFDLISLGIASPMYHYTFNHPTFTAFIFAVVVVILANKERRPVIANLVLIPWTRHFVFRIFPRERRRELLFSRRVTPHFPKAAKSIRANSLDMIAR